MSRGLFAFFLCGSRCPVLDALVSSSTSPFELSARVYHSSCPHGGRDIWLRVSGDAEAISRFEAELRARGFIIRRVHCNKFTRVLNVVLPHDSSRTSRCASSRCPFVTSAPPGAMLKSVVLTPMGMVVEYLVSGQRTIGSLRKRGCALLHAVCVSEADYFLTEEQEEALITAYLSGYYDVPRRVILHELARAMGISVSSLDERLRRAEAKVFEAFIRHELPHYVVRRVLTRRAIEVIKGPKSSPCSPRKVTRDIRRLPPADAREAQALAEPGEEEAPRSPRPLA